MSYPYQTYAYVDDIVTSGPAVDLSFGGVTSGIPGPTASSSYHRWRRREILTHKGGPTQVCEITMFYAAGAFRYKLMLCFPHCAYFHRFAATLTAALDAFTGSHFPRPRVRGEVVTGSCMVALLARTFLVTCARKADCY